MSSKELEVLVWTKENGQIEFSFIGFIFGDDWWELNFLKTFRAIGLVALWKGDIVCVRQKATGVFYSGGR